MELLNYFSRKQRGETLTTGKGKMNQSAFRGLCTSRDNQVSMT